MQHLTPRTANTPPIANQQTHALACQDAIDRISIIRSKLALIGYLIEATKSQAPHEGVSAGITQVVGETKDDLDFVEEFIEHIQQSILQ